MVEYDDRRSDVIESSGRRGGSWQKRNGSDEKWLGRDFFRRGEDETTDGMVGSDAYIK